MIGLGDEIETHVPLKKIKVGGQELTIDASDKSVNITLPSIPEYTVEKASTANTGMASTYNFKKDGVTIGSIDIALDMVVESGTVEYAEADNTPVEGLEEGDAYIDLVLANSGEHIYIPATKLVDVYTAGNGITVSGNQISINTADTNVVDATPTENSTKLVQSGGVYTALAAKQDTIATGNLLDADLVDDSTSTNKFVTEVEKATWNAKQDAIATGNLLDADLVDDSTSTNKFVTSADITNWNAKPDVADIPTKLSDLTDDINTVRYIKVAVGQTTGV